MKDLLFCYRQGKELKIRTRVLTDVIVPVDDVISPQKTTLQIPKNDKIEVSDFVIIKDNTSGKPEYVGYIDTLCSRETTEISCYPLINIFDNDFILDQLFQTVKKINLGADGKWVESETETEDIGVDAAEWLKTQITRAFIYTADKSSPAYNADVYDELQGLPLDVIVSTKRPVMYKKAIDTANLFEVYVDLFLNAGIYVEFSEIEYSGNAVKSIKCEIKNNRDERAYTVYEHDPMFQSVNIVDNTFSTYNKVIAVEDVGEEDRKPATYYFYLLQNNDITTNPSHPQRIKQVRSKVISFALAGDEETEKQLEEQVRKENEGKTEAEIKKAVDDAIAESRAKALILSIYNELQAPEYDLKIELELYKNDNLHLYRNIDFVSNRVVNGKNIVYNSNITKVEKLNDKQIRITLGALRNNLTDFKKKVEAI